VHQLEELSSYLNSGLITMQKRKAVFVDRDGVINVHRPDYIKSWSEFIFLPGILTAFRKLAELPLAVVVVSNQSVIGRGLVEKVVVDDIHSRMVAEIQSHGGRVDDVIYCPHHPDANCACRKPKPEMIFRVASRANLDVTSSYFIGDSPSDVEAAVAAGCIPVLVLTGRGRESQHQLRSRYPALDIFPDLLSVVEWILVREQQ
jgi:histidinol-phosphate phosphatase family protein